jgi:hypothetical protein
MHHHPRLLQQITVQGLEPQCGTWCVGHNSKRAAAAEQTITVVRAGCNMAAGAVVKPAFIDMHDGVFGVMRSCFAAVQILYDLRTADAKEIAAVDKLFKQRMQECDSVVYPGSSFGGAAITTTPTVYG